MPGGRGLFSLPSLFGSFASRQCFSFFNSFTSIYFRTLSANWPTETRDILCELNSLRALAKDGGWTSLGIPAKIYLPPFPSLTIFPSHFLFERSFLLAPPSLPIDTPPLAAYSGAPFFRESPLAPKILPTRGKRHHRPPRTSLRSHHVPRHGLHRRRKPAHPRRSGYACRRRPLRHLRLRRFRHAGHGSLGQLSYRSRARHVPQRLLHLFRRHRPRRSLANRSRRCLSLRRSFPSSDAHQNPRTHRQRHSRLPQARHRRRRRPLHRLHWNAQRESHRRQSRHFRRPRKTFRSPRAPRRRGTSSHRNSHGA